METVTGGGGPQKAMHGLEVSIIRKNMAKREKNLQALAMENQLEEPRDILLDHPSKFSRVRFAIARHCPGWTVRKVEMSCAAFFIREIEQRETATPGLKPFVRLYVMIKVVAQPLLPLDPPLHFTPAPFGRELA